MTTETEKTISVPEAGRRVGTIDNHGEFMLVEPMHNICVAGPRWDMTAQEVIEYCAEATSPSA
jgi:hypothetical protein